MPKQAFQCSYNEKTGRYRKRVKGINGKYVDLYDKDKAALEAKYKKALQDVEANVHIGADITVAEYAVKWFHLNTAELSPSRKSDHQISINNHILPVLGNMKIQDVQLDDVKKILLNMKNLSYSMQSKAVSTLKQIFSAAEENRLILRSPCATLKAGGYASRDKEPLSDEQAKVLIEAIKDTSVYPFVMLGLYTGLRREEILGLQWDCVHFGEVPYLSVRRTLTFDKCKPIFSDKLKTPAAKRNIPMPPQLVDCLQSLDRQSEFVAWKRPSYSAFRNMWKLVERRKVKEIDDAENGSLSPEEASDMKSKSRNHPNFKRTIDFVVSPHVLRHTYITNLILSGMNIKKVQYLAGHEKVQLTLDIYTKLMDNKPEDLADDISKAFSA